ncbi:hypothetical protein IWW34DRAFT_894092 [Fusarium oxysporum f. sp. albedinis]|uniref:Hemerythrin-like domain-containing protein n=1 Tax=Fusarium oxysporum (strain Fo5176) TaxID=660025 RepID=F9G1C8_FUSOF|nr:hypothetical protein FOXB_12460 [Fusarium oxysporum f. sp. conglutinans Fo5176]KAI3571893.1 hypothetical protein IWW34DRAFT_894092 [Fusarium oxysporum f. sp. albedinis]
MASISDAITKDHRDLKEYYNEVVTSTDLDHQQRYGNQFTWELARHSTKVKELLKEFQNMKPKEPEYIPKLKELWAVLSKHIEEEEHSDLPALEGALQKHTGDSESMAKTFGLTKAFVPSRSHPSAGEHPPFETVMGLITAPIDHIADIFRKFPNKTISPNPSTK